MMRFLVLEGEVVHIDDGSHRQFTIYYSGEVNRALCLSIFLPDNVRRELLLGRKRELRRIIGESTADYLRGSLKGSEWLSESLARRRTAME